MSLLFRDVRVLDDSADGMSGPTDVLVAGNRIQAIGAAGAADRVVECAGRKLLIPGLVNAHFHSPANHLKGSVRSLPLELFMLHESAGPAPTPREAYVRTALAAVEMLQRGTTSVQDDAFLMPRPTPEIIDAVLAAYRDCGMRATVALDQPELPEGDKLPFLRELAPPALRAELDAPAPADAPTLLEAYDHLIGTWHGAAGNTNAQQMANIVVANLQTLGLAATAQGYETSTVFSWPNDPT